MVRACAMVALCGVGCLYTDPINQKPVIDSMQVSPLPTRSDKPVAVSFDAYDPDGDDFQVNARVMFANPIPAVAGQYQLTFQPTGPGEYHVFLSATDSLGADSGEHEIVVDVPNMTPLVTAPKLIADAPATNGYYPLGTTFTIPDPTIDDDDPNPTVSITLDGMATGKTFRVLAAGHHDVVFSVTDVHQATGTAMAGIDVATDRWPCIAGTSPDANTPTLLSAIGETRRLLVTQVDDDLNPWPARYAGESARFQWLIGPGDGTFRPIPNWTDLPYYDLDTSGYAVGEQVQVRVIVTDSDSSHQPVCPDPTTRSCSTPIGCPDWVTWNVEFYQ